jgi:hypothetical protein
MSPRDLQVVEMSAINEYGKRVAENYADAAGFAFQK